MYGYLFAFTQVASQDRCCIIVPREERFSYSPAPFGADGGGQAQNQGMLNYAPVHWAERTS